MKIDSRIAFASFISSALYLSAGANEINDEDRGPFQIGEKYQLNISAQHPENSDVTAVFTENSIGVTTKRYTIKHEDASYISVHMDDMDLPKGCKAVTSACSGGQEHIMEGKGTFGLSNFWANHVEGDCMNIDLTCKSRANEAVLEIKEYAAGYPINNKSYKESSRNLRASAADDLFPFNNNRHLSICGVDDKRNAKCFQNSHPTEYGKGRAVARLIIGGVGACTGWLASDRNVLITNEHCIANQNEAQNTDFQFMYEDPSCDQNSGASPSEVFRASELLAVSASWDYAVVQLQGNPAATYGHLEVENRKGSIDEQIFIPQHPGARPKEFGIDDSAYNDGECKVKGFGGGCSPEDMKYSCDTEGGSSGSPVLSRDNYKVIALHHCGGGCNGNLGSPIYRYYDDISEFLAPAGPTPQPTTAIPTAAPTPAPISCPNGESGFRLTLNTDNYAEETSWTLTNNCDATPISSGDGYSNGASIEEEMCLDTNKEYTFTINDTWGDGICCSYGFGSYSLDWNGVEIHTSNQNNNPFGSSAESTTFGSCSTSPPTTSPVASPTTTGPVTLFEERFTDYEAGDTDLDNAVWSTTITAAGDVSVRNKNMKFLRIRRSSSITSKDINTSGYSTVSLSYKRRSKNLDAGETMNVEWSNNGGSSWLTIEQVDSSQIDWETKSWTLTGASGDIKIRFITNASGKKERGEVDNIIVTGN
jgi:hypothetical protein